jgi:hypothetical protein
VRIRFLFVLAAAISLAACSRNVQNEAAVRQGVIDYLSSKGDLNISQMQVEVTSISFRKDEADATVSFRPMGGSADSGMQMRYTLERQGNRWVVKGKGAGQHSQMPGTAPGMGQPAAPGGGMPPGHPPVSSSPAPQTKK